MSVENQNHSLVVVTPLGDNRRIKNELLRLLKERFRVFGFNPTTHIVGWHNEVDLETKLQAAVSRVDQLACAGDLFLLWEQAPGVA